MNDRPKFQTKFHVPKEEADGPWVGFVIGPANHTTTATSTPPLWLRDGGVSETRKAPSFERVFVIFRTGQKIALRNFSENAPLSMPIRTVELYNQPFLPDDYVAIKNMTAFKQYSIIQPNLKELG